MLEFNTDETCTEAPDQQSVAEDASQRIHSQAKALDEAGFHLYEDLSAAFERYVLDEKSKKSVDEFSDLPASQLVLSCSCTEDTTHPPYLIVQVTPELVRTVKNAMDLCQQHRLFEVKLAIPSAFSWAPVNDDGSTDRAVGGGHMVVTKDDFCICAGLRHSSGVVESVNVSLVDLMLHISSRVPESVFFDGEDAEEQSLREQLADDRADALADTSGETNKSNADLPQG